MKLNIENTKIMRISRNGENAEHDGKWAKLERSVPS